MQITLWRHWLTAVNQKWANQNGESPFMECDWLKCDVCKRGMMDRCEWANENGESAFWEWHWLERSIKKRGNFLFHKAMQSIYRKKNHYQCDVTSYIAGFQNGAEICCTLSCQKYGIFNGLADSFPTFFSNQYWDKHKKRVHYFFDVWYIQKPQISYKDVVLSGGHVGAVWWHVNFVGWFEQWSGVVLIPE